MIVYVDSNYHCHVTKPDGIFREVEHPFFNNKCKTFIEGYCYDDSKGYVQIYPWRTYEILAAHQKQYEETLAEMDAAYREGVNSV